MKAYWAKFSVLFLSIFLFAASSRAAVVVNYVDSNPTGLQAQATFELLSGGTVMQIVLKNNSVAPFGGGGANMVLSSISFDLGGAATINGGSVSLFTGSNVVKSSGGTWANYLGLYNLNAEYGYSNSGVGNSAPPAVPYTNALNAVTSHSNGGNSVTKFSGGTGLPGGLEYGVVANGSSSFGNRIYVLDTVDIQLNLSSALADLSFLGRGSYVEFGSDFAYVGGGGGSRVPEPVSVAVWSVLGLAFAGARYLRRR